MTASRRYACWTDRPQPHPWHSWIQDVACGYTDRRRDPCCTDCHRRRDEDPMDQLAARDALGEAGREQLAELRAAP